MPFTSMDFESFRPLPDRELVDMFDATAGWIKRRSQQISGAVPNTLDEDFLLRRGCDSSSLYWELLHKKEGVVTAIPFDAYVYHGWLEIVPAPTRREPEPPATFDADTRAFVKSVIPAAYDIYKEREAKLIAKRNIPLRRRVARGLIGLFSHSSVTHE